ncbi:hypothetical protein DACRYDRAFT_107808 [Dacryopinax primogenitus]|uniref:Uncharacterized protein n=1 Tax=Dacryopinax primogenitus (strain DJM 731) TaxID=1858805 RepID=M5G611_DACPD|nr:uncharacterized protein DACRYDRAFT_107808 [Dacryopinax primogenitus]EJU01252.1 hypothetical protein DACRYDRAFT_107808 [Dacryopinax primogenitus]
MSAYGDGPKGGMLRMDTQIEVISVLSNSPDANEATRAIRLWIESKQRKGKAEQDIIVKLEGMECQFLTSDHTVHGAFHVARQETGLPTSGVLP